MDFFLLHFHPTRPAPAENWTPLPALRRGSTTTKEASDPSGAVSVSSVGFSMDPDCNWLLPPDLVKTKNTCGGEYTTFCVIFMILI